MMRLRFLPLLAALCVLASLASCGDDSRFVVRGTAGDASQNFNLRYVYNSPSGFRSGIVAVREGKFEFSGVSERPTLVEMFEHDFTPLGRLYLSNGEEVECTVTRGNPRAMRASGSEINEKWTAWLGANSDALAAGEGNAAVARYITANPGDVLSTLLLLTEYDVRSNPLQADSLLARIDAAARPEFLAAGFSYLLGRVSSEAAYAPFDSLVYYSTQLEAASIARSSSGPTVLVFTDRDIQRDDTLMKAMHRLYERKSVSVADISLASDTTAWLRTLREEKLNGRDARWKQGWLPGNIGAPQLQRLGVPDMPYILVCDTAGNSLYRGADILEAEKAAGAENL